MIAEATAATRAGDRKPFAAFLAGAGSGWNLRGHRLWVLAEQAAEEDGWLRAWQAADPDSPDAALVHATSLIEVAWTVRSGKRAAQVGREQFEIFHRLLGEAVDAFARAAEPAPADPTPWAAQLPIALGLGWSHEEFDRVWQEIVARDPYHYGAHHSALQYWCRKWHGSHERMTAIAERAAAAAPPQSLLSGLRLDAVHELEITEDSYRAWTTPEAQRALDQVLADLRTVEPDDPRVPGLRHLLAYGLTRNRRRAEAVEQFRLIDRWIDSPPWSYRARPAELFTEIRARAPTGWDKAGRPPAPTTR
ncbi:hypothetical protein AB0K43_17915 [Kitasatospora sp. NPDC049258]|uniref:hypothetical protein n=1 Tax=Kitasatospora sp. NPDC049258 TaxID=3155394 RepID=UPI00342B2ABD